MNIKMKHKTRTLKEIYDILWNDIKDRQFIGSLCGIINRLSLRGEEWILIKQHFGSQHDKHPEFMTEERNWNFDLKSSSYWWNDEEDENPINRKAFIQKIISTL